MIDLVNMLLGSRGLFDMCKNVAIHPIAQLSATGKGMVESAVAMLAVGGIAKAVGGLASFFEKGKDLSAVAKTFSSMFFSLATIGLIVGFILFYILPFLPFIYFFFAVGEWIKSIFEAMVGVPLWALAHLRIDAYGLPGQAAENGYFLIFEIFIRPILTVVGLVGAFVIFAAMVRVLNDIFYLVIANLSGHDPLQESVCFQNPELTGKDGNQSEDTQSVTAYLRGPVDEFFYTVIYAIIVYMIGMACFKLIDEVPDRILRWMGTDVHSFGDKSGDPAKDLIQKTVVGGGLATGALSGNGAAAVAAFR